MPNIFFDALINSGEDALANHFQFGLIIPAIPIPGFPVNNLNLRVTNVGIPEITVPTYEVTKRGKKIERVAGVSDMSKEFDFTYRVDKYFTTYNAINAWIAYIQNPITLAMGSDSGLLGTAGPSTFRSNVFIDGLTTNNIITNKWIYTGCFPKKQDAIEFDEESGEPLTLSVTMSYIDIIYPGVAL